MRKTIAILISMLLFSSAASAADLYSLGDSRWVKKSDAPFTVSDLVSLGLTFHFRSDSVVCDTGAGGHAAALAVLTGYGVTTSVIACDEFGSPNVSIQGAEVTASLGTLDITGGESALGVDLIGLGATVAAGIITTDVVFENEVSPVGLSVVASLGSMTLDVVDIWDLQPAGISLATGLGTVDVDSISPGPSYNTSTFETGNDGWTLNTGGQPYCVSVGRTNAAGQYYAGSWGMSIGGSSSDEFCEAGFVDGYIAKTLQTAAGDILLWAKGVNVDSTLKIYQGGSLKATLDLTTSWVQYNVTITAQNAEIKLVPNYAAVDGSVVDNIQIPIP